MSTPKEPDKDLMAWNDILKKHCIENRTITKKEKRKEKSLRKHAYSNILNISPPKTENFQIKKNLIFFIFLFKTYIVDIR